MTDLFGFMDHRENNPSRLVIESALQLAAVSPATFNETAEIKLYLANSTDGNDEAINIYEKARVLIGASMKDESERRLAVWTIRSGYTRSSDPELPIDWNSIPYTNDAISSITTDG